VTRVDPAKRCVALRDGEELAYDALMVCVGAKSRPAFRNALTLRVAGEQLDIGAVFARADGAFRMAFVVPPGVSWSLPTYELTLMAERRARQRRLADVR
jgi:sulfide:quinone oxidoreductase